MAADIGARIGIDGEKTFRESLGAINAQLKTLGSEMKATVAAFAGMEDSETSTAAKGQVLQKSLAVSAEKIEVLQAQSRRAKQKLSDLAQELEHAKTQFGENSAEAAKAQNAYNRQVTVVNRLQTQINQTTADMSRMEREMRDLERGTDDVTEGLRDMGNEAEESGSAFRDAFLGGAVAGAVQSLASSISGLVESTTEYRKIMGTLEVSSEHAGYSAEETTQVYRQLYGVLGDTQQAATATANLQALGVSQQQLKQLTEGAIGAWATYGDSIPIDGLAEAINETVKVGQVTGTFADVLNWAGTSEDVFNERLAAAGTESERANLVLQELTEQGLMNAAAGWRENNAAIWEANEASAKLEENTGRLGEILSPMVTTLKEGINAILGITLNLIEEGNPLLALAAGLATAIAGMGLATLISQGGMTVSVVTKMKQAFTLLNATMKANPILLVTSLLAGLVAAFVTAYQTNEEFRAKVNAAWADVKAFVGEAVGDIVKLFQEDIPAAVDHALQWFFSIPEEMRQLGGHIMEGLWNGIAEKLTGVKEKVQGAVNSIKQVFTGVKGFFTGSPSRWARKVGGWVMQGLGAGMQDDAEQAIREAQGTVDTIKNTLQKLPQQIELEYDLQSQVEAATIEGQRQAQPQSMQTAIASMQEQEPLLMEYITGLKDRILELIESFCPEHQKTGTLLMQSVAEGVERGESGVVNAVAKVLQAAVKAAREEMDIHSPSGVFKQVGSFMAAGVGVGWSERIGKVSTTLQQSMQRIAQTAIPVATGAANYQQSYRYGDINLYIDRVDNGNGRSIETLAKDLEFLRRQQNDAKGGNRR